ncbi:hypothetical protein [Hathewaya limosa]|uniref:Uncharacterized protein n=1 Tax=Hathewaya limosa TaxID=1536 RepID=A0ABU0JX54_HATLI|nr:hypothetical protein [Hathewaya limosa]MDQ0480699.1 hypothetical protein [Hathewaya limosa]
MKNQKFKYVFITFNLHIFAMILVLLFSRIYYHLDKLTSTYANNPTTYIYKCPIIIIVLSLIINLIFILETDQN